ncbi:PE family protein [Mycobacterium sp.]|uniref:PE family protein n=1 Tax=Mycobacterium sp. TaxID=1785 RepID=UPI002C05B3BC|nr:PE family protein [Mycobacterium sp.]HTY35369.1 PE family protein [Mycobacterium sp.]
MSFVFATPEYLAGAASDLANIASTISSANAAALGPTSGVLAAGADEVSATIATLFGAHAEVYQALSAQAALFHQQFVELMSGGAAQYALAEAANASPLQTVEQAALGGVSAPGQASAAAVPAGNGVSPALPFAPSAGSGAFGPGGAGATGRLVASVGPAAAAAGGGEPFGMGGAGFTGSLVVGQNLGAVPAAGGSGGLLGSGGAVGATEAAEEVGLNGYAGTPLPAAVPAAAPVGSSAPVRPATPAYSAATAAAAEPAEE